MSLIDKHHTLCVIHNIQRGILVVLDDAYRKCSGRTCLMTRVDTLCARTGVADGYQVDS